MKYYIYISDAKLDMLYPQVPHDLKKKVATKIGIDLKLITATKQSEHETEENRLTKLQTVVEYIRGHERLGTVDAPAEYVEDILSMRSADWGLPVNPGRGPFIYFGGETETTLLGLWGARKHVLGGYGGDISVSTSCATFAIWDFIQKLDPAAAWDAPPSENEARTLFLAQRAREFHAAGINAFRVSEDVRVFAAIRMANGELHHIPAQRLHFIAKRLASQPGVLLGTPLFVALAE